MEKERGGKILAVIALVLAVAGLSIGFAAYTSTLNIASEANVQVGTNQWSVGFSADGTNMAPLTSSGAPTVNGSNSNGSISLMKYTISQVTAATLSTTANDSVSYSFYVKNAGSINASLASITWGSLSCEYDTSAEGRVIEQDEDNIGARSTAADSNATISSTDCDTMFDVSLTFGTSPGTTYTPASSSYSNTINAGANVPVTLTITSTGTAPQTAPVGDFVVTLGNTTLSYQSA